MRVPELRPGSNRCSMAAGRGGWVVNQGNYFDGNTYANSEPRPRPNSALIMGSLPPAVLQPGRQPPMAACGRTGMRWIGGFRLAGAGWALALDPTSVGATGSLLGEVGFAPEDVLGLGPGVYRIQPFVAQVSGLAPGLHRDHLPRNHQLHQRHRLHPRPTAPSRRPVLRPPATTRRGRALGWVGRFGFGGSMVSAGATAQVGTGIGMRGPLDIRGLFPSRGTTSPASVWSGVSPRGVPVPRPITTKHAQWAMSCS